ncbi:hypothetical protein [Streptomyces sp. NPDC086787]|uniref:hypothetical protein n=1 Tax=Streptomyces sp. NPDC086787 TaxID=3365759 RepID=UPI0037FBD80B
MNVPSGGPSDRSAGPSAGAGALSCHTGVSAGIPGSAPQVTRRSCSPPNPDCWAGSAPHAGVGCGSSSKKCGPVSSTAGGAGSTPRGAMSGSPSRGAGRLVPGTQAAPFQYRTYPGMDGSG